VERVEGINAQLSEVGVAWRTAYAVNKPDELVKSERDIRRRMKLHAPMQTGPVDGEAFDRTMAKLRKLERIERRKRKGQ
jgi:hypothetical protein